MANASAVALLLQGLSPEEQQELLSIADYLGERADPQRNPGGNLPEGGVASVLNSSSPKVREKLLHLNEALETPRYQPFQEKRGEAFRALEFGLDPENTMTIKAALDTQEVAHSLQRNMGTDKDLPDEPLTTRDILSSAYDLHSQETSHDR